MFVLLALPRLHSLSEPTLASLHSFSSTANWLIPKRVMCGRYPGSCPSRPTSASVVRERLAAIRAAGMSTFVCLQSELPPQDASWPDGGVGGQSNNAPDAQTAPFLPYREAAGSDASFLYFGIPDLSVAESLKRLDDLVADLAGRVGRGEGLYLHCWGGRGRTGLVAACLLGALYGDMEAEEALQRVQLYHDQRGPERGGLSPETEEQRQQVREWFRVHRLRGGTAKGTAGAPPATRRAMLRRAVHGSAVAAAALLPRSPASLAAESRCGSDRPPGQRDRCDVGELMASTHVPLRLREALRISLRVTDGFNELTSECSGERECTVSARVLLETYLAPQAPLIALADEGVLREPAVRALVSASDREAYARNVERYESSVRLAASCAGLAQYDPQMPSFPRGGYVPKGLKDGQGNLLGSNLENSRDFLLDARDALLVACSFIFYTRTSEG